MPRTVHRAVALAVIAVLVPALSACRTTPVLPEPAADAQGTVSASGGTSSTTETIAMDSQGVDALPEIAVSNQSIEYARSIGGTSQEGKTLYFVIGDSVQTEEEARAKLEKAIPLFGDMQSYFIVQKSDHFEGMRPGWWIVAEAYKVSPSEESLSFGRRAFPEAYVKRATVRTSDPIPVYEDLVPSK